MLKLLIAAGPELWDEEKEEFIPPKIVTLQLEHSLVSLSKWEMKWHKPFLDRREKTVEETVDYIRCMTITQNVDPSIYDYITDKHIRKVNAYIENPMTATWFSKEERKSFNQETITSELIYYWMIANHIDIKCEKWHLNRLLTLIRVCNVKNAPPEKLSAKEIAKRNAAINAARRKASKSKG